ncbi:MAG: D-2-hydroxyacid dehydrogenase [Negativicutes bacterium]|nr:D-2-hydroxyacid dehydrogenase [Negativicutes bacterium]
MASAPNILILNRLADRHVAAIKEVMPEITVVHTDLEHAGEWIAATDILVAWGMHDIRALYAAAPRLKWVHALSAGVENLIFPELQTADTILTNSKGIHGIPISEHVFALILAFSRGLNLYIRQQTAKEWKRQKEFTTEIHEKTLGIVGLGSIGRELAKKAKGLGMNVVAVKREITSEIFVNKLYTPDQLEEMLGVADFVVVALPLTEETNGLFGLRQFAAMKPSAYFFNIARGAIVREKDLVGALEKGLIRGAGLDVFEEEPLPQSSPLWDRPDVIITPHVGGQSPPYLDRAIKLFVDNLTRYTENREMVNLVDKIKGY